jgi:hypothetical protein
LPPLGGVRFLNVSYNRFSGVVDSGAVEKFGLSAFVHAGNASSLAFPAANTKAPRRRPVSPPHGRVKSKRHDAGRAGSTPARAEKRPTRTGKRRKHLSVVRIAVICGVASLATLLCLVWCVACGRCRKRGRKQDEEEKKTPQWSDKGKYVEEEAAVLAETKGASAAPVVLFERLLTELTLADLAAATSGFGRESQLAEPGGRSGAAYRAVLPGDLHVVVRVMEGAVAGLAVDDDASAAATAFREIARLRHPNILPLIGYCIAGKRKFFTIKLYFIQKKVPHCLGHNLVRLVNLNGQLRKL